MAKFTFIDLFSGIGGFRIPLKKLGGECLGFSEIDQQAIKVYENYFGDERNFGDITKVRDLPNVDVLVGGVPCQSWSVAGRMKGFDDPRGRLWYDSIRAVKLAKPKVFIFENVRGLYDPRNRDNLNLIVNNLENLGYWVFPSLLNSYDFGLPQNRERIFIVGFKKSLVGDSFHFSFPKATSRKHRLYDFFDGIKKGNVKKIKLNANELFNGRVPGSRNKFQKLDEFNDFFVLCDTRNGHSTIHSWDIIETSEREKHICMTMLKNRRRKKYGSRDGNPLSFSHLKELIPDIMKMELQKLIDKKILRHIPGVGYDFVNSKNSSGINGVYRVYLPNSEVFSTLTATGTKDKIATKIITGKNTDEYKKNFIEQILKENKYRDITAKEAAALQGFPKGFPHHHDEERAKRQFGNAVSIPVVSHLMKKIVETRIFDNMVYNFNNGQRGKEINFKKSPGVDEKFHNTKSREKHYKTEGHFKI